MKITGYQQSITNVGGSSGSAPRLNLGASAKASASEALDLNPVIKGIGDVTKTIDYINEQEDKANILAAMDSYNQNVNDLMHNETDGLMNTKEEGAAGITNKYLEGTKKIKDTVLGNTKLHFRGNQLALDNFFNKASEQGFEQVRAHQTRQNQIVKANHYNNIQSDSYKNAVENYSNKNALALGKLKLGLATDLQYGEYGPERVEVEKRKAYNNYAKAALNSALTNNDYSAFDEIRKEYGEYLEAGDLLQFNKVAAQKQSRSIIRNNAEEFANSNMTDEQIRAVLKGRKISGTGTNSSLTQGMRDLMPTMTYYDPNNRSNTYCAKAITSVPGLKGTAYEGVTWVPTLIEKAKANKQWITDPNYVPKPGDMAVVNGDNHVVMVNDDNGTIQNGASGNGGKGGIYESRLSPKEMFGEVTGYIRTSDYNNNGPAERDYTDEEIDQIINRVHYLKNDRKRQEREAVSNATETFAENLFMNYKGMSYADAIAMAEKEAGNNMKLHDAYVGIVNSRYQLAGMKPGRGNTKADASDINVADEMLADGKFKDLNDYLGYVGSKGANDTQMQKALQTYKDYTLGEGKFAHKLDNFKSAIMGNTGLKGAEAEEMWNGIKLNGRMAINDWIAKNDGKKPSFEDTKQILEQVKSESIPVRVTTRNKNFLFDERKRNADAMTWRLANYGVVKVDPMVYQNGPKGPMFADDMYLVRFRDGSVQTMNGTRLYMMSKGMNTTNLSNLPEEEKEE